jgi:hypothetical protein
MTLLLISSLLLLGYAAARRAASSLFTDRGTSTVGRASQRVVVEPRQEELRAVRDALRPERRLRGQPELPGRGAGGDDHGPPVPDLRAGLDPERRAVELDSRGVAGDELDAVHARLLAHPLDELGPSIPSEKPGKFSTRPVSNSCPPFA